MDHRPRTGTRIGRAAGSKSVMNTRTATNFAVTGTEEPRALSTCRTACSKGASSLVKCAPGKLVASLHAASSSGSSSPCNPSQSALSHVPRRKMRTILPLRGSTTFTNSWTGFCNSRTAALFDHLLLGSCAYAHDALRLRPSLRRKARSHQTSRVAGACDAQTPARACPHSSSGKRGRSALR